MPSELFTIRHSSAVPNFTLGSTFSFWYSSPSTRYSNPSMIRLLPVCIVNVTVRRAAISESPIRGYSRVGVGSFSGMAMRLGVPVTSNAATSISGADIISPIISIARRHPNGRFQILPRPFRLEQIDAVLADYVNLEAGKRQRQKKSVGAVEN